ncbi:serine hydrolase domain-containing protein [Rhodohalobacter sp. 614A]|uniref:serine hydrolase domain-containing protein n=1 Tax=Rhodohalobacter sp. 614A TaxID=2908649 RepID=UPI001F3D929F|nr:serine hydrolase [Rhodohalobacter sp. 614A]
MKLVLTFLFLTLFIDDGIAFQQDSLDEIFNIGTVQSLVIQKNDQIIYEEYRGSIEGDEPTNIKSASKSIISLLVGIAIDKGFIEGVDQTIGDFFPEYFEENPDSAKAAITIRDLLTMRSGLETTSFRNYGRWVMSSNWVEFTLDQPFAEQPGGRMVYSTGTSHLLSVILTKATGMSTRAFANEYLFGPMDIRIGGWDRDPQGYYMGGNNLAVAPLDLLKIGELMMNVGEYGGQQLISKDWIMESVQVYTRSNFNPYNYGYMWWRRPVGNYQIFFAWGNGGQYIMILPELDAIISITSDLGRSTGSRRYQDRIFDFLRDTMIPFIEETGVDTSS